MKTGYEAVIGLEVHVQLATSSKMFCTCRNEYGRRPNSNTCPVCLSLPGSLPVINNQAVRMAIAMGLAINGNINERSTFFRKHYFYPDLPNGYQITQGTIPIIQNGYIAFSGDPSVRGDEKNIKARIERVHLEEDAGKSSHEISRHSSYIDFNRAGVPLLEVVGAPDLKSGKEAYEYLKTLHKLVTFLGICSGNLEEGSFRCDANISVHNTGQPMGTRVEVKNINSFRFVKMAIDYEIDRQINKISNGDTLMQETRGWDSENSVTKSQRSKESVMDYCYIQEPNIPDLIITKEEIKLVKDELPELPDSRLKRFINQYDLTNYEAKMLMQSNDFADFFELVAKECSSKQAVNWMLGEVSRTLNNSNMDIKKLGLKPKHLIELIQLVQEKTINLNTAKEIVFPAILTSEESPKEIVDKLGLNQVSDRSQIETIVEAALLSNQIQLNKYLEGKENLKDFFVGQVMKNSKGKVDPLIVKEILGQALAVKKIEYNLKDKVKREN